MRTKAHSVVKAPRGMPGSKVPSDVASSPLFSVSMAVSGVGGAVVSFVHLWGHHRRTAHGHPRTLNVPTGPLTPAPVHCPQSGTSFS